MRPTWLIDRFRQYARDLGWSTAGLANAWTLAKGSTSFYSWHPHKEHLAQCVQAMNTALSPDRVEEIERILPVGLPTVIDIPTPNTGSRAYC